MKGVIVLKYIIKILFLIETLIFNELMNQSINIQVHP